MASKLTSVLLISGPLVCGFLWLWYRECRRKEREEAISKLLLKNGTNPSEFDRRFKELQKNKGSVKKLEWDNLMGGAGIKDPEVQRHVWRNKGDVDNPDSRIYSDNDIIGPGKNLGEIFDEHDGRKVGKIDFDEFKKVLQVRAKKLENKQITIEVAERVAMEVLDSLGKDKTCEITKSEFCTIFLGQFNQTSVVSFNSINEDELKIDIYKPKAKSHEPEEKYRAQWK
jgi:hypothetical protein